MLYEVYHRFTSAEGKNCLRFQTFPAGSEDEAMEKAKAAMTPWQRDHLQTISAAPAAINLPPLEFDD